MWIFNYFAIPESESGKINSNHTQPLQGWNYWEFMVVLIKCQHPKLSIQLAKALDICKVQGFAI
jgi:hypothetical protein